MFNYNTSLEGFDVPVVSHEIGTYEVSPDFNDIPKFTGVTRARNYEIFKERLRKANMLDQADDFVKASGKLAVICYREEIESALRTRDLAGFQLLDIQDFPGQGTALVGILNDFMEPKGLITPEKWHQFCSEVVPLLEMKKYTWTNDERFTGDVKIAQYGKGDFDECKSKLEAGKQQGRCTDRRNIYRERYSGRRIGRYRGNSFSAGQDFTSRKTEHHHCDRGNGRIKTNTPYGFTPNLWIPAFLKE